jgi:pyridoxamine 5'-phosphate oxidase
MQLSTVDEDGRPSLRTVLLKGWGARGLEFYTNYQSRKGQQLSHTPHAAVLLHWKSRERQLIAEGRVELLEPEASDRYFASRGRGSQLGAWASVQSEELDERSTLEDRLAAVTARFDGKPVTRPPHWGGFILIPDRMEFWQGMPDRLHVRTVFERTGPETWDEKTLYP